MQRSGRRCPLSAVAPARTDHPASARRASQPLHGPVLQHGLAVGITESAPEPFTAINDNAGITKSVTQLCSSVIHSDGAPTVPPGCVPDEVSHTQLVVRTAARRATFCSRNRSIGGFVGAAAITPFQFWLYLAEEPRCIEFALS